VVNYVRIYDQYVMPDLFVYKEGKPVRSRIAIDLGARYGEFTFPYVDIFGGKVISFEPLEKAVWEFKRKRLLFGYGDSCPLEKRIVWYNHDPQIFHAWTDGDCCLGSLYKKKRPGAREVPSWELEATPITLEEILTRYRWIDVLKMDIEGAEFKLMEHTPREALKKVGQITMEVHDYCDDRNDILGILKNKGFVISKKGRIVHALNSIYE